jgi:hypothetical protein
MTATAHQLDLDQPRFAISIGGKIYGPYAAQQMRSYIAEGRVTASSLISREGGAWTPASDDPFCAQIFGQRTGRSENTVPPAPAAPTGGIAQRTAASSSAREAFLKELEGVRGIKPVEAPAPRQVGPPRPDQPAAAPLFPTERDAQTEPSNFIIVFDVRSRGHGKLEEHIMSLGRAVRVMQGMWLLNAAMTSGAIRNQLMKHFGSNDTFVIVDATRDKLAWFNLGPEIDSQIRQVWRRG